MHWAYKQLKEKDGGDNLDGDFSSLIDDGNYEGRRAPEKSTYESKRNMRGRKCSVKRQGKRKLIVFVQ